MSLVPPINQLMNNYTVRLVQGNRRASPFHSGTPTLRKFFKDTHIRINDSVAIPMDGYTPIYCSNNEVCGYGAQVEISTPGTTTILYHEEPDAGLYASYYTYQQHTIPVLSLLDLNLSHLDVSEFNMSVMVPECLCVMEDVGNLIINITRHGSLSIQSKLATQ